MVYTYTPAYYSSLHDSITSICKNILPFSFKKKRLPAIAAAEQKLSKLQSDNLKWQQESFHQILKLMGLCKEGIVPETEVSAFKSHLVETLIASHLDYEQPAILRDKLIFLQELLYAKIISEEEYDLSKKPLLQRLSVQGVEIQARDVFTPGMQKQSPVDEWSEIDLKEDKSLLTKENSSSKKSKQSSVLGFISSHKNGKSKEENTKATENPFWNKESETKSILMSNSLQTEKKRKPFKALFQKDQREDSQEKEAKLGTNKKQWSFDGFKKWRKNDCEDETTPLSLCERSDLVEKKPLQEEPDNDDTTQIKRVPSDFFVDKVLADKIKKELLLVQAESNVYFTDEQIDVISTKLPVDKADLIKFFPKTWCDRYGFLVLDVVRKELKDHGGKMGNLQKIGGAKLRRRNSKNWTTFDDAENCCPNNFIEHEHEDDVSLKDSRVYSNSSSIDKGFKYNPFFDV